MLRDELTALLQIGGFNLQKWLSNSDKLLKGQSALSDSISYAILSEDQSSKVLGIIWDPKIDCFSVSLPKQLNCQPLTKRTVLSIIAQIFDPNGFVGPLVVIAKIFIQSLWKSGLS